MKDLSGDGKITKKDVLMGRGVIARKSGGMAKGSREGSVIKAKKGTRVTDKALKQSAKTAFKPKNKKA